MNNLKDKKVLILGDSIMYGAGNYGKGVGEFLEELCGCKTIKRAVNGATIAFYSPDRNWIVDQVKGAIKDKVEADYIILDGFTNDCFVVKGTIDTPRTKLGDIDCQEIDINEINKENNFSECFKAIMLALKKNWPNSKILFIRPHNMGSRVDHLQKTYGQRAIELCRRYNIDVCDIYSESTLNTYDPVQRDKYTFDSHNEGKGDCSHPNELCYKQIYMPIIIRHLS